jgi:para-nitrobenzyl esterase
MNASADTAQGRVSGLRSGEVLSFKGIPFAAPPVGELRFGPPQPAAGWTGVRDAASYGAISLQPADPMPSLIPGTEWNFYAPGTRQSEDCLNLNVWTPAGAPAAGPSRPVMMWIHGGGNLTGSGTAPWYDGTALAACEDIVVVTVNYRLGALGGLVLPDDGAAASNVLLDLIAALRWIAGNIAAFGGDPGRVVVAGQSAGAMNIGGLLAAPAARSLFHGAIMQSGHHRFTLTPAVARQRRDLFLAELGIGPSAHLLADLQAVPAGQILAAQQRLAARAPSPFRPVTDGTLLPQPGDGRALTPVPLLIGTNTDEHKLFSVMRWGPGAGEENLQTRMRGVFTEPGTEAIADELAARYRDLAPDDDGAWDIAATDRDWRGPVRELADQHAAGGAAVYQYEFTWPTPVLDGALGACHAIDIPFPFGNLSQPGVSEFTGSEQAGQAGRAAVERQCREAWGAFVRAAAPRSGGLPDWPRYQPGERAVMMIGPEPSVARDPHAGRLDAWAELARVTRPPLDRPPGDQRSR